MHVRIPKNHGMYLNSVRETKIGSSVRVNCEDMGVIRVNVSEIFDQGKAI